MPHIEFEWDIEKARRNVVKHGVSFIEAQTCFFDENAQVIDDPDHSIEEERFILIGLSVEDRILVVVHCYRDDDENIRLISARRANRQEKESYRSNLI